MLCKVCTDYSVILQETFDWGKSKDIWSRVGEIFCKRSIFLKWMCVWLFNEALFTQQEIRLSKGYIYMLIVLSLSHWHTIKVSFASMPSQKRKFAFLCKMQEKYWLVMIKKKTATSPRTFHDGVRQKKRTFPSKQRRKSEPKRAKLEADLISWSRIGVFLPQRPQFIFIAISQRWELLTHTHKTRCASNFYWALKLRVWCNLIIQGPQFRNSSRWHTQPSRRGMKY